MTRPVAHVLITLIDLFEPVGAGHHRVEVEQAVTVEAEQLRHVRLGPRRSEDGADQFFLHHHEVSMLIVTADSVQGWTFVTTTRPRLAARAMIDP